LAFFSLASIFTQSKGPKINNPKLDKGDFVFVKKEDELWIDNLKAKGIIESFERIDD